MALFVLLLCFLLYLCVVLSQPLQVWQQLRVVGLQAQKFFDFYVLRVIA